MLEEPEMELFFKKKKEKTTVGIKPKKKGKNYHLKSEDRIGSLRGGGRL